MSQWKPKTRTVEEIREIMASGRDPASFLHGPSVGGAFEAAGNAALKPSTKAIIQSNTAGLFHPKRSDILYNLIVYEDNFLRMLPKSTYQKLGNSWDLKKSQSMSNYGHLSESGGNTFPTAVAPEYVNVENINPSYPVITTERTFQAANKESWSGSINVAERWDQLVADTMEQYKDGVNAELHVSQDTTPTGEIETPNRIIMDAAELARMTSPDDGHRWNTPLYAPDEDPIYESQVNQDTTLRTFEKKYIDDVVRVAKRFGKSSYKPVIMTSDETLNEIERVYKAKELNMPPVSVKFTQNGLETRKGDIVGMNTVSAIVSNGITIPIFTDPNVIASGGGMSDILIPDLGALDLREAFPMTWYETKLNEQMGIMGLANQLGFGMYAAQIMCYNFRSQAKVRDLKVGA